MVQISARIFEHDGISTPGRQFSVGTRAVFVPTNRLMSAKTIADLAQQLGVPVGDVKAAIANLRD